MSEKKPKIDLKARLGKKTVAAPMGAAIPPPVGIPKPPVMGAFGSSPSQHPGAVEREPPRVIEPQAIKVEMSEEVVEQHRKVTKRGYVVTAVVSLIVGGIGFTLGGSTERGKGANAALDGARTLIKEIEEADKIADQLNEVLAKASERLSKNEYPDVEITALGGINIPFDGGHLTDKGIGRLKRDIAVALITYANMAQKANDQKEKLQNLLSGSKAGITELLLQKTDPKIRWSVYVQNGPGGPWASMQLLPSPFLVKSAQKVKDKDGKETDYEWPAEFQLGKDKLKRFKSGDPTAGDPQIIPVAPLTESSVCPSTTIVRLRGELGEMQTILKGDSTPGAEKTGLLQMGEQVVQSLKKIGQG